MLCSVFQWRDGDCPTLIRDHWSDDEKRERVWLPNCVRSPVVSHVRDFIMGCCEVWDWYFLRTCIFTRTASAAGDFGHMISGRGACRLFRVHYDGGSFFLERAALARYQYARKI